MFDTSPVLVDGPQPSRCSATSGVGQEFLDSSGSSVANLKHKGIDGRAPPGVEPVAQFDSTRENLPGPDIVRIDRLRALS